MICKSTLLVLALALICASAVAQTRVGRLTYFDNDECKGYQEMIIPVFEGDNTLCSLHGASTCAQALSGPTRPWDINTSCGNTTLAKDGSKGVIEIVNGAGQTNNKVAFGKCVKSSRYAGCYCHYTSSASIAVASIALVISFATLALLWM